jgi:hypothetical protein
MQHVHHPHSIIAFQWSDLTKYFALLVLWFSRGTEAVLHAGTIGLALGSVLFCLVAVLPSLFLLTLVAQFILWPLARLYE